MENLNSCTARECGFCSVNLFLKKNKNCRVFKHLGGGNILKFYCLI